MRPVVVVEFMEVSSGGMVQDEQHGVRRWRGLLYTSGINQLKPRVLIFTDKAEVIISALNTPPPSDILIIESQPAGKFTRQFTGGNLFNHRSG